MDLSLFNMQPLTPLVTIESDLVKEANIKLMIKRDELIHPFISGNKWRKLKYNIIEANNKGYSKIVSFGGAFSNHLHALAYAGNLLNIETIGLIRGEIQYPLNSTLEFCVQNGMILKSVSRNEYNEKDTDKFLEFIKTNFPNHYILPEGGKNIFALKGLNDLLDELPPFDTLCVPAGSGTTAAGILKFKKEEHKLAVFSAIKNGSYLKNEISELADSKNDFDFFDQYHQGGFAKINPSVIEFTQNFYDNYSILLDPIYTSKMMMGIMDLIKKGHFKNQTIIALHTGGLQGWNGFKERNLVPQSFFTTLAKVQL